jgi:hypothetical protein
MANDIEVESRKPIERHWWNKKRGDFEEEDRWGGVNDEDLEGILKRACDGKWDDCAEIVTVNLN